MTVNVDSEPALTGAVIGAGIAVHRELGPGLDEAVYEQSLSAQLRALGLPHVCQQALPLRYKNTKFIVN
jgi:GxxExxY protein